MTILLFIYIAAFLPSIAFFCGNIPTEVAANESLVKKVLEATFIDEEQKPGDHLLKHTLAQINFNRRLEFADGDKLTTGEVADFIYKMAEATIFNERRAIKAKNLALNGAHIVDNIQAKLRGAKLGESREKIQAILTNVRKEWTNQNFIDLIELLKANNENFPVDATKIAYFYYRFYREIRNEYLDEKENKKLFYWMTELLDKLHVKNWPWNHGSFGKKFYWTPEYASITLEQFLPFGPIKHDVAGQMKWEEEQNEDEEKEMH